MAEADTVNIPLSNGAVALVDADYAGLLDGLAWHPDHAGNTTYAFAQVRIGGKRVRISMHRLIIGARAGQVVDHIDRNGLNNTRRNLRFCTHEQNLRNQRKRTNTSGFHGVSWAARHKRWRATITVGGKWRELGSFVDPVAAARAYDAAAVEYFGEFAAPNFPVSHGDHTHGFRPPAERSAT